MSDNHRRQQGHAWRQALGAFLALTIMGATGARADLTGAHLRVDLDGRRAISWSAEISTATFAADLGNAPGGFISLSSIARPFRAEAFGNFHTMGIILDLPPGYRPRDIGAVQVFEERTTGDRRLLDPVQVGTERFFATSVFGLTPGTPYAFRASFIGTNGVEIASRRFSGRTRAEPGATPPATRTIHIAEDGDDTFPGTEEHPKRSLRAAIAAVTEPGTHIVLGPGVYYEGSLLAPSLGTAEAPIVIKAAPGAVAVIDGSDPDVLQEGWTDFGEGYFARPFDHMPWLVAYRDRNTGETRRCYPVASMGELREQYSVYRTNPFSKYNITGAYHFDKGLLTVYCPAFKPSGDVEMRVARHVNGLWHTNAPAVVYERLTFRFFDGRAIMVQDAPDVIVRQCIFRNCNVPIGLKGESPRLLVEGCAFLDDCTRWGLNLPKSANGWRYAGQIETGAVNVYSPYSGRGLVMRNNTIDGLFDGALLVPRHHPLTVKTSETDFYNNRVLRVTDDLLELDGYCRNVRVFNNRMERFLTGVSIAQGVDGPTYVLYNVLGRVGEASGTEIDGHVGYPVKTNGGEEYGPTGIAFFLHNSCWTPVPDTPAFFVKRAVWRRLVMANNIWYGTHIGWRAYRSEPMSPITMSHDILWHESGPFFYHDHGRKKAYGHLTDLLASPLTDMHFLVNAKVRNPRYRSPGNGDYGLSPDSPAIDAGIVIPGINDRGYLGSAPDIGAFEYEPTGIGTLGAMPSGFRFSTPQADENTSHADPFAPRGRGTAVQTIPAPISRPAPI